MTGGCGEQMIVIGIELTGTAYLDSTRKRPGAVNSEPHAKVRQTNEHIPAITRDSSSSHR